MNVPYTYLLVFTHPKTSTKEYYYGVQYGQRAHPDNLWSTYFSSSKAVKYRVSRYGKDSFHFEVRRVFDCPLKARIWEERVLRRLGVVLKKEWLNRNDSIAPPTGSGQDNPFYGLKHTSQSKEKMSKIKLEHHRSEEYRKKYIEGYMKRDKSYLSNPEYKKRQQEGLVRYHSTTEHESLRQRMLGSKNPMYGKPHSDETRRKISQANKNRFCGSDNPMYGKQRSDQEKIALRDLKSGTKWMHNEQTSKQVKSEYVQTYLENGWFLGRKTTEPT